MAVVTKAPGNAARMLSVLEHHDVRGCHVASPEDLQTLLAGEGSVHAALVDVAGFGQEIWSLCETLRQGAVPFFLVSGDVARVEAMGARHGAQATLRKPLSRRLLAELIENLAERVDTGEA